MGITKVDRAALIGAGKAQMERLAVSVTEAGRLLGISRNTAYTLVASGEIPSVRIGGMFRVPLAGLQRLLAPAALIKPAESTGDVDRS